MSIETKNTVVVLNVLGTLAGILSTLFLIALIYLDSDLGDNYYLVSLLISIIVTILTLGFAKIIELLNVIQERLENSNLAFGS